MANPSRKTTPKQGVTLSDATLEATVSKRDLGNLMVGQCNNGTWQHVGNVGEMSFDGFYSHDAPTRRCRHGLALPGIDNSYAGSLRFDALSVNHGVFDALMGTEKPMRVTLGYRQRGSCTVRHRHIWEYRRERRYGKRRGRVWFTRMVVIPDVMVTSAGREFAVGVDSPVEVEFRVGGQGWLRSSSKACS